MSTQQAIDHLVATAMQAGREGEVRHVASMSFAQGAIAQAALSALTELLKDLGYITDAQLAPKLQKFYRAQAAAMDQASAIVMPAANGKLA